MEAFLDIPDEPEIYRNHLKTRSFGKSEDPDEMPHAAFHQMPHNAAFRQGLHCLLD